MVFWLRVEYEEAFSSRPENYENTVIEVSRLGEFLLPLLCVHPLRKLYSEIAGEGRPGDLFS